LSRLNPVGDLSIDLSIKNGNFEFFVWSDDENASVSVFNGQTLVDTEVLGSSDAIRVAPDTAVAFGTGVLFTAGFASRTTYFYNETGTLTTIANHGILMSSSQLREEGIFLVDESEATFKIVKLIAPSLTPVFVNNLPSNGFYAQYDDRFTIMMNQDPVDFSANFRVMQRIDLQVGRPVFEFYSVSNFTKVLEFTVPMMTGEFVAFTNGLFLSNQQTQTVKHVSAAGVETTYTNAQMFSFIDDNGILIANQQTRTVYAFFNGQLIQTYSNKSLTVMSARADYGSGFMLRDQTMNSYALHAFDAVDGLSQFGVYAIPNLVITNNMGRIPTAWHYNNVSDITTVAYFNHGWKVIEVQGEYSEAFNTFTTIDGVDYAISLETQLPTSGKTFLVKALDGRANNNTVHTTTITGVDVFGVDFLGVVNGYLILTLNDTVTRKGTSFIVDLLNETYVTLPEDIWYMRGANFIENNGVIHGYGELGTITVDVNDVDSLFTTSSGRLDDTEVIFISLKHDFFGEDDDLVILTRQPFPNPTNATTYELYQGNSELGFESLTLLTSYSTTDNTFTNLQLVFAGNNIYAYSSFMQGSLITLKGPQMPANFYVQSGALVALEDDLTEVLITTDVRSVSTNIF